MSSALADSSAGWPGPGEPSRCPVPLILIMNGYGSRRTYWLIASAPVLSGELSWWAEGPTPSQRAPRQRRGEVLAALVGEPRRGSRLVPNQPLVGLRLEHVRESSPGDDQCRGGDPVAFARRLVGFPRQPALLAEDAARFAAVVVGALEHAQPQDVAVDEAGRAGVQEKVAAVAFDHAPHHAFERVDQVAVLVVLDHSNLEYVTGVLQPRAHDTQVVAVLERRRDARHFDDQPAILQPVVDQAVRGRHVERPE